MASVTEAAFRGAEDTKGDTCCAAEPDPAPVNGLATTGSTKLSCC